MFRDIVKREIGKVHLQKTEGIRIREIFIFDFLTSEELRLVQNCQYVFTKDGYILVP